jgi:hypothetical protein
MKIFPLALCLLTAGLSVATARIPGINLLDGYQHKAEAAEDSAAGKIWKEGGITIHYDIGRLAGQYVDPARRSDYAWFREQQVNGHKVYSARTKDGQVLVTFAGDKPANFHADCRSQDDVADMLLMVLTYDAK